MTTAFQAVSAPASLRSRTVTLRPFRGHPVAPSALRLQSRCAQFRYLHSALLLDGRRVLVLKMFYQYLPPQIHHFGFNEADFSHFWVWHPCARRQGAVRVQPWSDVCVTTYDLPVRCFTPIQVSPCKICY